MEGKKYSLMVSHDCGCSYQKEAESDDYRELQDRCEELDAKMLRWVIEDEQDKVIKFCRIHKEITGALDREHRA